MKKRLLQALRALAMTIIALFTIYYSLSYAASTTNKYQVTLTKFELYNGTDWVTLFDSSVSGTEIPLDIASVTANQSVGNFLSGLAVPDGTYTRARATPSTTFIIRGSVDGTYYTTAGTSSVGGRTVSTATTTSTDVADCTVAVLSSDVAQSNGEAFSGGSLTVTNGTSSHKVRVSFDLSNALTSVQTGPASFIIYPGAPTVTITLVEN